MKRSENQLKTEEISIIKAMLERKNFDIDEIVSHFNTSTRSIDSKVICEIKDGKNNYNGYETAKQCKVDCFLENKSSLFPEKELSRLEQAYLIKSRNAMTASFRNLTDNHTFSIEISVISSVIAWTTLYHAIYENEGQNNKYKDGKIYKYKNLYIYMNNIKNFELRGKLEKLRINRNEIEHGIHKNIDDDIKKVLIDTLILFNRKIKCKFGERFGLENFDPFVPIFQSFISDRENFLHKYPESDDLLNEFKSLHTAFSLTKWQSHLDLIRKFPRKIFDIIWNFVKKY